MLGPAGSPEGSRPGQFLGGNALSEDAAPELREIEIAAPGAPATDPYTEGDFAQGQSTDILDIEDLEELSQAELKAAKAHVPALSTQAPTPEKSLPGLAPVPSVAKPAAPPTAIADSPSFPKRKVLYGAAALVLGAAAVVGAFVVLDDSTPQPAAQAKVAPVRAAIGGPVGVAPAAAASAAEDERAQASPPIEEEQVAAEEQVSAEEQEATEEQESAEEQVAPAAGTLVVASSPAGATVYLDGDAIGETPLQREALSGSRLTVVLDGHALYETSVGDVGDVEVDLKPTETFRGSGGIKVRCKSKDRYRVFVDGVDTGELCPTDRLGVDIGEHVVETYDLVTGERRSFDVDVKSKDRSLRVRVD